MKSLLFIGHAYHKKTKSSSFILEMLKEEYDITTFFYDPNSDDEKIYKNIGYNQFNVVICWQILPPRHILDYYVKFDRGVFFPMYDYGPCNDSPQWNEYRDFLIINFSKTMHQDCLSIGLSSRYIQYFPKPEDVKDWGKEDSVFFWNRITPLNINTVADLLKISHVSHLHIHKAVDPSQKIVKLNRRWKVSISESEWYDSKSDMLTDMDSSALYIAPRLYEGIGMSFLEAMAHGRCVIAPNFPTMNEYIEHGVTGLLYDFNHIEPLTLNNVRSIQKKTHEFIKKGYENWEKQKKNILKWISSPLEYKRVLLFDATVLINGLCNGSGRTGIYFVAYNIFCKLLDSKNFSVVAYCDSANKENLKEAFKRYFKSYSITILTEKSDVSFVDAFVSPIFKIPPCIQDKTWISKYIILYDLIIELYPEWFKEHNQVWVHELLDSFNKHDGYFSISNSTKKDFLKHVKGLQDDQITVIPLAANENFYPCPSESKQQDVRKKYGIPNRPYMLSLCSLEPRKNLLMALKAFIQFKKTHQKDGLLYVLSGSKWENFEQMLIEEVPEAKEFASDIIMTGYVDDVDLSPLYSGAEFFIYTSLYEGFGLPPLEAMQCGTPVITSNVTSLPEVVGNAGLMIDPLSLEQHVEAIEKMHFDAELRRKLTKQGIERAKLFSWDDCVSIIENKIGEKLFTEFPVVTIITCIDKDASLEQKELLSACIYSVQQQQYQGRIEHLLFDASSLGKEFALESRVRRVEAPSLDIAEARVKALNIAEGEYVVFLSMQEQLVNRQAISCSIKAMRSQETDFIYADSILRLPDGRDLLHGDGIAFLPCGHQQNHRCMLLKKAAVEQCAEDGIASMRELLIKLESQGKRAVHVPVEFCYGDSLNDEGLANHAKMFHRWIGRPHNLSLNECYCLQDGSFVNFPREVVMSLAERLGNPIWSSAVIAHYFDNLQQSHAASPAALRSLDTLNAFQGTHPSSFFLRLLKYKILSGLSFKKSKYKKKYQENKKLLEQARRSVYYLLGVPLVELVQFSDLGSLNFFRVIPLFTWRKTEKKRSYMILGIEIIRLG